MSNVNPNATRKAGQQRRGKRAVIILARQQLRVVGATISRVRDSYERIGDYETFHTLDNAVYALDEALEYIDQAGCGEG